MPTYQYACTSCGHRFEAVQAFTEDSLTTCPECSGQLRKVYGSVGVVFKGSGFYRTDSRAASTATAPAAGGEKSDKAGDKAGAEKKVAATADSAGSSKPAAASPTSGSSGSSSSSSGSGSSGGSSSSSKAAAG